MMHLHQMTIGLYDRKTEKQEIADDKAKEMLTDILLDKYNIYAFTMLQAWGVYRMESTGKQVREPSIRIEIWATEDDLSKERAYAIIRYLLDVFNQESIMYRYDTEEVEFIER